MDDTTEPIIVILGNPVAGNPSQLALERGLDTVDLPFRVLSMNVEVADLATAVAGLKACGVRAILLDPVLSRSQAIPGDSHSGEPQSGELLPIDLHMRDAKGFHSIPLRTDIRNEFLREYDQVDGICEFPIPQFDPPKMTTASKLQANEKDEKEVEVRILKVIGDDLLDRAKNRFECKNWAETLDLEQSSLDRDPDHPVRVDVMLTSRQPPWHIFDEIEYDDSSIHKIYTPLHFEIEFLAEAFRRITGHPIKSEIIADAMEEYQSV